MASLLKLFRFLATGTKAIGALSRFLPEATALETEAATGTKAIEALSRFFLQGTAPEKEAVGMEVIGAVNTDGDVSAFNAVDHNEHKAMTISFFLILFTSLLFFIFLGFMIAKRNINKRQRNNGNIEGEQREDQLMLIGNAAEEANTAPDQLVLAIDHHDQAKRRNCLHTLQTKRNLGMPFVVINLLLEIPSAVLDQISPKNKHSYLLIVMILSSTSLLVCLLELVYEVRKKKITWRWSNGRIFIPWFYDSCNKPFGTLTEMNAWACAIAQCVVTTINYRFYRRNHDALIKMSVWPLIFAFGLLCSKVIGKLNDEDDSRESRTTSDQDGGDVALNQAIMVVEPLPPADELQQ
ncbi:hypothetical protein REPUB_Repub01dG0258400 [Reevesia pubescens]